MIHLIQKISDRPHSIVIAFTVFAVSQVFVLWLLGPAKSGLIVLQTSIDPESGYAVMQSWSALEWEGFWAHLKWDVVHPVIYSLALAIAMVKSASQLRVKQSWPVCLAMLVAAIDILENFFHMRAAQLFPNRIDWLFFAGGLAAITKWLIAAGCLGLCSIALLKVFLRRTVQYFVGEV
jgi:hypothetical protein